MPNFSDQVMVYDRKKVIGADEPNACAQDAAFVRRGFNFTCSESDRTRRKKWTSTGSTDTGQRTDLIVSIPRTTSV